MIKTDFWGLILAGGPMLLPLMFCSILLVAVIAERFSYFLKLKANLQDFMDSLLDKVRRHQIKEALSLCESQIHPLAIILKAAILKYDRPRNQIKEAMEDSTLFVSPQLERHLGLLYALAQLGPMLGLLGTSLGLAQAFYHLQSSLEPSRIWSAELMAKFGQAFIVTIFGLTLGVLAFLAYHFFLFWAKNTILELEKKSTEFLELLTE